MLKTNIFLEANNSQQNTSLFVNKVKEIWTNNGNDINALKSINVYIKPNDNNVYYVINGSIQGQFEIF